MAFNYPREAMLSRVSKLTLMPVAFVLLVVATSAAQPTNFSATVTGSTVVLTWIPPAGSVSNQFIVEAALTPGGAVIASLPVTGTALSVPNVPSGTYFVRVRQVGGPPSNEITVVVSSGCAPVGTRVQATATNVAVSWGAGCAGSSFVVQAGSGPGLANIAVVDVGGQPGISAIAPPGLYYIRIVANSPQGTAVTEDYRALLLPNTVTDTLNPTGAVSFPVVASATGTYQAVLTWHDPSIDLDLYLTTPTCPYPPTGCLLAISDGVGVNQEQVAFPVTVGQTYRLWVDNFSTRPSSFSIANFVGAVGTPVSDSGDGQKSSTPTSTTLTKKKPGAQ